MAGGGAAGRAAGAAGPGLFCSCADEPMLAAITETPRKNAAKQTPRGSIDRAPLKLWSPANLNARAHKSFAFDFCRHCDFATQERCRFGIERTGIGVIRPNPGQPHAQNPRNLTQRPRRGWRFSASFANRASNR
jgi:hypothetical protein